MNMEIVQRTEAKEKGLKYYFTGKACKHGHMSKRLVVSYKCVQCDEEYRVEYRDNNQEYFKNYHHQYFKANPDRWADPKEVYRQNRERHIQAAARWRYENPARVAAYSKQRHRNVRISIPKWYEDDLVQQLYLKRDELNKLWGITLQVDHIVPLQGKNVCGLHCWHNLQLLESSLNASKKNTHG